MAEKEYIGRSYLRKMAMLETAYAMETTTDAEVVLRMIEEAPSADVAPVVHGRWIKTIRENGCAEWTDFTCSVCGSVFDGNDWLFSEWKGCPVCLAKMDLGGG